MKRFFGNAFRIGVVTSGSLYTISYLYTNNYIFSNTHNQNQFNQTQNVYSPYEPLKASDKAIVDLLDQVEISNAYFNSISYKMECNVVVPIVKFTESITRFSRTMYYMSRIAQRYLLLQYRFPTRYDEAGNEIIEQAIEEKWMDAHIKGANDILTLCIKNGGIFIKFGQYLSTMQYIVPDIYCNVLDVLKDRAPPIPIENISKVIYEEFGRDIRQLFKIFKETPIAAASVAQVHHAVTVDGREVAVKVQYPSVKRNFDIDTFTLDVLVKLTALLFPGWNFTEIAPYVKSDLYTELDFEHEKRNARLAAASFKHRNDVHIPEVYDDLTSKRILTTEFIHGIKITDVNKLEAARISVQQAASIMLSAFAEQIFVHGHLHADPHAGNHMMRRNPKTNQVEIVILDHGLYQTLSDSFRIEFCKLWKALVVHDDTTLNKFCKKYNISDPALFSAMLLMRSYDHSVAFSTSVKKSEFEDLKDILKFQMDRMVLILTKLPRQMLLIFRNLSILRSINIALGASANRFKINAKIACQGITQSEGHTLTEKLYLHIEKLIFQYWILRQTFVVYLFECWMKFAMMIGIFPNLAEFQEEMILAG